MRRLGVLLTLASLLTASSAEASAKVARLPSSEVQLPDALKVYRPGSVIVLMDKLELYFIKDGTTGIKYPIAIGKNGKGWKGKKHIDGKHWLPAWRAPAAVVREKPELAGKIFPSGDPANPMGWAALTLSGGDEFAIHGTNKPESIGTKASSGCFRMYNEDVGDLFQRVTIGTPVVSTTSSEIGLTAVQPMAAAPAAAGKAQRNHAVR